MNKVILYTKENCALCDEVKSLLQLFETTYSLHIIEQDIAEDEKLMETYMFEVPVIEINGEIMEYRKIDYLSLEKRLH